MITKKNRPRKTWVDKGTEFAGECKIFGTAQGLETYSIMRKTKALFAERTKRSIKKLFNTTWKTMGTILSQKAALPHKLGSQKNYSVDLILKNAKKPNFVSIFHSKKLQDYRKSKFKNGDRVRISRYELFSEKVESQYLRRKVSNCSACYQKPPYKHKQKVDRLRIYEANFIKKFCLKSVNNGLVNNSVGL